MFVIIAVVVRESGQLAMLDSSFIKYSSVSWSMPFLFSNSALFVPILKEIIGEEFSSIANAYGSPFCLWSGGRPTPLKLKNMQVVEKTIYSLLEYNVIPSFTLTNNILTKKDLNDCYCNELLRIISESGSQIVVASDLLYEYIKDKYPDIKLVSSVIKFLSENIKDIDNETEYINTLIDKYDRVVVRSEYISNEEKNLKDIKDLSKLVVLVNSTCEVDCPVANKHYNLISSFFKEEITYNEGFNLFVKFCPKVINPSMKANTLSSEDIQNAIDSGITHLKLQGRQVEFNEMFSILCRNFFKETVNKDELKERIDKFCSNKLQNSLDLQMYSMIKNI